MLVACALANLVTTDSPTLFEPERSPGLLAPSLRAIPDAIDLDAVAVGVDTEAAIAAAADPVVVDRAAVILLSDLGHVAPRACTAALACALRSFCDDRALWDTPVPLRCVRVYGSRAHSAELARLAAHVLDWPGPHLIGDCQDPDTTGPGSSDGAGSGPLNQSTLSLARAVAVPRLIAELAPSALHPGLADALEELVSFAATPLGADAAWTAALRDCAAAIAAQVVAAGHAALAARFMLVCLPHVPFAPLSVDPGNPDAVAGL
jgi:hypothetical protein